MAIVNSLVLHVGMPKTGTSSIQKTLMMSRDYLINNQVLYPTLGTPRQKSEAGHHNIYYQYSPGLRHKYAAINGSLSDIIQEVERFGWPRPSLLLSSEGFKNLPEGAVQKLIEAISPKRVLILMYIRRPDSYVHSGYLQNCKFGKANPAMPDLYLETHLGDCFYGDIINRYHDALRAVGRPYEILKRPFSRRLLVGSCAVKDFISQLVARNLLPQNAINAITPVRDANKTPSLESVAVAYHLKSVLVKEGRRITPHLLQAVQAEVGQGLQLPLAHDFSLFTAQQANQILQCFREKTVSDQSNLLFDYEVSQLFEGLDLSQDFPGLPNGFCFDSDIYREAAFRIHAKIKGNLTA